MNQYPAWKYALIIVVLLVGGLYALPNLFGEDPALQITSSRGFPVPAELETAIEDSLVSDGIAFKNSDRSDNIVQHLVAAAEDPVVDHRAVILIADPAGDNHRRRHDQFQRREVLVLSPIVVVQERAAVEIDAFRARPWCGDECRAAGEPPFRSDLRPILAARDDLRIERFVVGNGEKRAPLDSRQRTGLLEAMLQ